MNLDGSNGIRAEINLEKDALIAFAVGAIANLVSTKTNRIQFLISGLALLAPVKSLSGAYKIKH